jgi:hypothetical protein
MGVSDFEQQVKKFTHPMTEVHRMGKFLFAGSTDRINPGHRMSNSCSPELLIR